MYVCMYVCMTYYSITCYSCGEVGAEAPGLPPPLAPRRRA